MASVYVSGDDSKSLVQFTDKNVQHDRSYYGNGCPNTWGTDGLGGSDIPCSTRILRTVDDEEQVNGTMYHFQAATAGTGGAMSTQNANSSDTFCPLGWQLPYAGTGGDYYNKSRSWKYLLTSYSIAYDSGDTTSTAKIRSYPFSVVYPGQYHWGTGRLYYQNIGGYYYSSTILNDAAVYRLEGGTNTLYSSSTASKLYGFTLRCVTRY